MILYYLHNPVVEEGAVDFCVLQCTTGLQCTTEDALKMMPNFEFVIINVITTPFKQKHYKHLNKHIHGIPPFHFVPFFFLYNCRFVLNRIVIYVTTIYLSNTQNPLSCFPATNSQTSRLPPPHTCDCDTVLVVPLAVERSQIANCVSQLASFGI